MKARPFLLAVALAAFVLLGSALGIGWAMARQSPIRLVDRPLALPRAARFVPRDAALSLHWLVDPARLPAYAEAVAPIGQRRAVREGMTQLRQGVFALAGLDFEAELADWLGPQVSVALLEPGGSDRATGWVLALASRDQDGARRFLQRFWQTRSLAGTDLQISRYRGIGVISGRGALLGRDPQPIATALIDDDLLLLASGRGALEQALDSSQLDAVHQLGDPQLQAQVQELGRGVALLTASPQALEQWLGLPAAVSQRDDLNGMVAALKPEGADLQLDGLLRFRAPVVRSVRADADGHALIQAAGGPAEALAVLEAPANLMTTANDPLVQWLGPLLRGQLDQAGSPALRAVATLDAGPLLWERLADGWLLGTDSAEPEAGVVDAALQESDLVRSTLEGDQGPLSVWTRLQRQRSHGKESLATELAVAREASDGAAWWGLSLQALGQRRESKALRPRLEQLDALAAEAWAGGVGALQQLALDDQLARDQLQRWRPWTLLQVVAGRSLLPTVQGMAMAVVPGKAVVPGEPVAADSPPGSDQASASDTLRLRAHLSLG